MGGGPQKRMQNKRSLVMGGGQTVNQKSISFIQRQSIEDNEAQEVFTKARNNNANADFVNQESEDEQRYSDLDDSYSDDDYDKIPIDENKLREFLDSMQQNSLSEMNQLQEEQQRLENQEKDTLEKIKAK